MLKRLNVKNIALIKETTVDFNGGLNIISGETGSGKSVLIDSLNFVLGAKADKSMIRNGEKECFVKAEFAVQNEAVKEVLSDFDIEYEEDIIISRKYNIDGKGDVKINGESVTLSMLKRLTSLLVDVHGQSEHFFLLKEQNQLDLIDKYANDSITQVKEDIHKLYTEYKKVKEELDSYGGDEGARAIRIDVLEYQIKEIESADIRVGEEEELINIRNKCKNQEKILIGLKMAYDSLNTENGGIDAIRMAQHGLSSVSGFGEEYSLLLDRIENAKAEISDIADTIESQIEEFDFDSKTAEATEERLDLIKNIKKKYGATYEDVQNYLENAKIELDKLTNFVVLTEKLTKKECELKSALYNKYLVLSKIRKLAAKEFSDNVTKELRELGMQNALFEILFNEQPSIDTVSITQNGFDKIEFNFTANLGEPLKPLSKIISGGEASRFMLAIKAQTSKLSNISTFIFDEIDVGISGNIAKVVGEKFAKIALSTQIIAITHLPQIAAMGDTSILISKNEKNGQTLTHIKKLNDEERVQEITRLVGGDNSSENAINHAKEMIEHCMIFKKSLYNN